MVMLIMMNAIFAMIILMMIVSRIVMIIGVVML